MTTSIASTDTAAAVLATSFPALSVENLLDHAERLLAEDQAAAAFGRAHEALGNDPTHPLALHTAGLCGLKLGDVASAAQLLEQALHFGGQRMPANTTRLAAIAADLGNTRYAAGQIDMAVIAWDRSLALLDDPVVRQWRTEAISLLTRLTESGDTVETRANQIAAHFMLAAVARSTSSWAKAATNLRTALELDPTNQETLKAFVDLHVGVVESAPIIAAYRVFLRAHPEHNEVRLALARSLILASRGQEAVIELQRVVDRAPDHMDALGEHAHLLTHMGRFVEVHRGLQAAAQRHQLDADRTQEIGRIYLNLHKFQEALALFNHALAINPRHARAMAGRGACFDGLLDPGPAVRAYMEAIDLTPNDRWVALRLSALLAQRGAFDASQLVISNFLAYSPSDPVALVRDALLTPVILDDVAMIDAARKRYGDKFDALATHSEQIALKELAQIPASFDLAYHGRNDRELLGKMTSAMSRLCPALNFRAPHTEKKRQTKRLRVGIISNFLRLHTIGRLYRGIIEHFDRRKFELIIIRPFTAKEDEWSRAIDACAATTVSLPRSLEAAQHLLASLELDTLLFTDIGMDEHCFLLAFGRYARVQAVSWGHPDTTGIPTIDYFISSARIETADADTHYSERLVRLPNLPSHYKRPMAGNPFNRAQFGLPSDMRLYGCPQSLFKFHPEFDPLLAGILRTDPKALIVVPASMPTWRELLRHRLKATMPDMLDRVRFTPNIPSDQFLGFLGSMDVLLDPIHFGGGNTTYESMSMGAPVVTWPKEFMRARVTAGAYDQMGFNELVVNDATSYVERAVRVANDDTYRRYCVQAIQDASNQVIENMSAVRELEAFFARAYAES